MKKPPPAISFPEELKTRSGVMKSNSEIMSLSTFTNRTAAASESRARSEREEFVFNSAARQQAIRPVCNQQRG